jgi:hypothetical protein
VQNCSLWHGSLATAPYAGNGTTITDFLEPSSCATLSCIFCSAIPRQTFGNINFAMLVHPEVRVNDPAKIGLDGLDGGQA